MTRRARLGGSRVMLALWISIALGAGCLGRSPDARHYMLGTGESVPESEPGSGLAVLVGPVRLPPYLERAQLARLEEGGEVRLDEFSRWLGGFEANFIRALSFGIARALGSERVVGVPSEAPFAMDYRVRLHVDDMIFEDRGVLRVRIRWALRTEPDPSPSRLFVMDERIPVAGSRPADLVEAYDSALRDLAHRIANEISDLEESRSSEG